MTPTIICAIISSIKGVKMSSSQTQEKINVGVLLATLCVFSKQGREEVSISEFQESVASFQQVYPLGYSFSEQLLLSPDLLYDLRGLEYRGYLTDYHYKVDGLLPKRFLTLTALGRGIGNEYLQKMPSAMIENLTISAKEATANYHKRWRLWVR